MHESKHPYLSLVDTNDDTDPNLYLEHIREFEHEILVMYSGLMKALSAGDPGFQYGHELVFYLEIETAENNREALLTWIRQWLSAVYQSGLTFKERTRLIFDDLHEVLGKAEDL